MQLVVLDADHRRIAAQIFEKIERVGPVSVEFRVDHPVRIGSTQRRDGFAHRFAPQTILLSRLLQYSSRSSRL